jgi:hypothetical protein
MYMIEYVSPVGISILFRKKHVTLFNYFRFHGQNRGKFVTGSELL